MPPLLPARFRAWRVETTLDYHERCGGACACGGVWVRDAEGRALGAPCDTQAPCQGQTKRSLIFKFVTREDTALRTMVLYARSREAHGHAASRADGTLGPGECAAFAPGAGARDKGRVQGCVRPQKKENGKVKKTNNRGAREGSGPAPQRCTCTHTLHLARGAAMGELALEASAPTCAAAPTASW